MYTIINVRYWTWDDFYDICKVVSKGDKTLPDYGEGNLIFDETYINSFAVDYIDDKGHKVNLTNPKIAEWLNFEKNIRKLNTFGTPINDNPSTLLKQYQYNELNNGNFAFLPMDITEYDYINYRTEYPNIDIINYPIDSQQGFYKSYCYSAWINNKSSVSEEAFYNDTRNLYRQTGKNKLELCYGKEKKLQTRRKSKNSA